MQQSPPPSASSGLIGTAAWQNKGNYLEYFFGK